MAGKQVLGRMESFIPGRSYTFLDLPAELQTEAKLQEEDFEVAYGAGPEALLYRFEIFPNRQSRKILQARYGKALKDMMEDPRVQRLASQLSEGNVVLLPVLGDEGLDRALAVTALGWDVPVLQPILPIARQILTEPPTLEGRSPRKGRR